MTEPHFLYPEPRWGKRKKVRHVINLVATGSLLLTLHQTFRQSYDVDGNRNGYSVEQKIVSKTGSTRDEMVLSTIVFVTASGTWTVPADCFSANYVDTVGGGGSGGIMPNGITGCATGGGGGAFSRITNYSLTPGAGIQVQVGSGGVGPTASGTATAGNAGGDTWFNGASLAASACGAKGGGAGGINTGAGFLSGSAGGLASSGIGTVKYNGGASGSSAGSGAASGGGGSAGFNGPGGDGTATPSGFSGSGGTGDNGNTAANTNGTQYDATHGFGGGGFGNNTLSSSAAGSPGGRYGGGGGACYTNFTATGGSGFQGVCTISYTPSLQPPLVSSGGSIFAPKVNLGLTAGLFTNTNSFFSATVTRGAVNLAPSLLTDGDTFFSPVVGRGTITLSPTLLSDGDTFFTPLVMQIVQPPLLANVSVFFSPTISQGTVAIVPVFIGSTNAFFSISLVSANIVTAPLNNQNTFFLHRIEGGVPGGGTDKKRRAGFETIVKRKPEPPKRTEPPKVWMPPASKRPALTLPRRPAPELVEAKELPADLLGMQHQIYTAEDISDVQRFLNDYDQDQQDADDIADILAILD